jgi:alkylhydroperoxidase/carboxymuconolactone decarboxylase family protein YurZ
MTDARDGQDPATARIALLAAAGGAIWRGDWPQLRGLCGALRSAGWPRSDAEELLLQAVLFCGFPRVVSAFAELAQAWPAAAPPQGGALPAAAQAAAGRALFAAIYGDRAAVVEAMLRDCHADFHAFVFDVAYGRVLARPGLAARDRELLAAALLAAQDQPRQFISHARGALRLGASRELLRAAVAGAVGDADVAAAWCDRLR